MTNLVKIEIRRLLSLRVLPFSVLLACYFSYVLLDKLFHSEKNVEPLLSSGQLALQADFRLNYTIYGVIILGAFFLGTDFTQRTLHQQIANGHSRKHLVVSKSLVFTGAGSILLLLTPLLTMTVVTLINGWGATPSYKELLYVLRVYCLAFLLNASLLNVVVLISFIFQDIGRTLIFSTIFAFLSIQIAIIVTDSFPVFDAIYRYFPTQQLQIIVQRSTTLKDIMLAMLSSVILWTMTNLCAIYVFEKVDLTKGRS
ncbi:hypothetical protein [Enterococcus sp. DIV0756]|uniref:hypothetical protein n=1 Tax=Enterococcus sp. DIV0756 TaxID=2774636 RepID=UPI003F277BDE